MNALLLSPCTCCGAPIVRHRLPNGRQISCDQVRRIDEQLLQSGAQPRREPRREFQVIPGGRDQDRAIARLTFHAGEV